MFDKDVSVEKVWGESVEATGEEEEEEEESLNVEKNRSARRTPSKQTLYSGCVQGNTSEVEPDIDKEEE